MKKLLLALSLALAGCGATTQYRAQFGAHCQASCTTHCGWRIQCDPRLRNDCKCICIVPKAVVQSDPNWMHHCDEPSDAARPHVDTGSGAGK